HLAGMAVISRDPSARSLAQQLGALAIDETGNDLNSAITQARQVVGDLGAEGVLMLPTDLPLLTLDDLNQLYTLARAGRGMVIAPSHDGGTNALLLRPPHAITYAFGEASFARHLALAEAAALPSQIYRSATLAL